MIRRLQAAPLRTAALCGAINTLGFAPFDAHFPAWPLPLLSLAGLFLVCQGAAPRSASLRGLAWGSASFLFGVSWVYVSLAQYSGMPPVAAGLSTLIFCLYLALFPALACATFARWQIAGASSAVAFAGAWALSEWLRGTLLTGFPWLATGYSQTPPSPLAGYAPVIGVFGVGLVVALVAATLVTLWQARWRGPRSWATLCLIPLAGVLLHATEWTQAEGKPLRVALLQGNVAQDEKWDPQRLSLSVERYIDLARANPAALTVLPETAIPMFFDQVPHEILEALTKRGEAILGVAVSLSDGGYTNGAVAVTPKMETQAYAKRHLVPFGEYPPPGIAWFFRWARIPMSNFTAGPARQKPLVVGEQHIAPNICYEDLFGEELLPGLAQATLLLNLSNTAWFGDSMAQPQHLQVARMRAMETGRVMLRATNTGMTAMVAPNGQVAAALQPFVADALVVDAQGYSGLTPYARWGNVPVVLLALAAVFNAWRQRRKAQTL